MHKWFMILIFWFLQREFEAQSADRMSTMMFSENKQQKKKMKKNWQGLLKSNI